MELRNKHPSPSQCQSSLEYYSKPREIVIFTGEEDPDDCPGPPKLPPISGVLASSEVINNNAMLENFCLSSNIFPLPHL